MAQTARQLEDLAAQFDALTVESPSKIRSRQRISNGDILELLLGVPERWLAVWIEGLPKRIYACVLTPYEVSRIELHERSFLRWSLVQDQALKRLATKRLEEIEEARWRS